MKQKKEIKTLRRSSLIYPYGVGAIVPFGRNESVMIGALEYWRYPRDYSSFLIEDDRLCKRLGVRELRLPPVDKNPICGVRFPSTYYCPECHFVLEYALAKQNNLYSGVNPECPNCREKIKKSGEKKPIPKMKPDRFVVVCPNGHIADFPVTKWVHRFNNIECDNPKIYRRNAYSKGYGDDVIYECSTCGAKVGMCTAVGKGKLAKINHYCSGRRPWMGVATNEECDCKPWELMVLPKGSSNLFFPVVVSSIYLPECETFKISQNDFKDLKALEEIIDAVKFKEYLSRKAENANVSLAEFEEAYKNNEKHSDVTVIEDEDYYRYQEYRSLSQSLGDDSIKSCFYSENKAIKFYSKIIQPYFSSISQIHKLKETRAFVGFSRLIPSDEINIAKLKKQVSLRSLNWLPAIQIFGEGIFLEFNYEALKEWASKESVINRTKLINAGFHSVSKWSSEGILNPEFVLLHTVAHLLINQLSYDCGYGSSSIREKIYCQKSKDKYPMCGILIYTASSDSEGSMGGLVKQGQPVNLENTIITALKNATWCSSDPICIESRGQGMNSCNLAACHNCTLISETSCENMNCLLDRGLVVGTLDNPEIGYFHKLIEECF